MFTIRIDRRKTNNAFSANRIRFPFNAEISSETIALTLTPQISGSIIGQLFLEQRKTLENHQGLYLLNAVYLSDSIFRLSITLGKFSRHIKRHVQYKQYLQYKQYFLH